jgi:hypothetical protein
MGESAAIIDLGELRPVGDDDDLLPVPGERLRHQWRRNIMAVLAGLLCLALTAAGPAPPALAGGFAVPLTRAWYVYDRDELYLVSGPEEVAAYSLDDGHQLWRTSLPHQVSYVNLRGGPIAVDEQGDCSTLTRLDPRTGAVSWTRTGVIVGDNPPDGTVRIVHDTAGGCAGDASSPASDGVIDVPSPPQVLDVVDPETGVARLSIPIKAGGQWTFGADGATAAVWDEQGHMVEIDLTTGATVVSGTVPALANGVGVLENMMPSVWAFDDLWAVIDPPSLMPDDVKAVVSTYDRHTLAPLWSVSLPAPPADTRQFYSFLPCVPTVVCVQIGETESVTLDVATGRRLPNQPDYVPTIGGHWTIVSDPTPTSGDLPVILWDTRTNRETFPGWKVQTFAQSSLDRILLSQAYGEWTEFAIFDGASGRLNRLGGAAGAYNGCELALRQLLCLDGHLALHVWPIRG